MGSEIDPDGIWLLDVENWSLRVAEALDYAAALKGNWIVYGMAVKVAVPMSPGSHTGSSEQCSE